jgi:hypothetical protein
VTILSIKLTNRGAPVELSRVATSIMTTTLRLTNMMRMIEEREDHRSGALLVGQFCAGRCCDGRTDYTHRMGRTNRACGYSESIKYIVIIQFMVTASYILERRQTGRLGSGYPNIDGILARKTTRAMSKYTLVV